MKICSFVLNKLGFIEKETSESCISIWENRKKRNWQGDDINSLVFVDWLKVFCRCTFVCRSWWHGCSRIVTEQGGWLSTILASRRYAIHMWLHGLHPMQIIVYKTTGDGLTFPFLWMSGQRILPVFQMLGRKRYWGNELRDMLAVIWMRKIPKQSEKIRKVIRKSL